MKRTTIVIALAAVVLLMPTVASVQKLVFVVRHAERADTGRQKQPRNSRRCWLRPA